MTVAVYDVGTCQVVNGSDIVTFNAPAVPEDNILQGQWFQVGGDDVAYQAAANASGNTVQLSTPYAGETDVAASYEVTRYFLGGDVPLVTRGMKGPFAIINRMAERLLARINSKSDSTHHHDAAYAALNHTHAFREVLTGHRNYYVNGTLGNDSNEGLSPGSAFKTKQKAVDTVAGLDTSIFNVAVTCTADNYPAGVVLKDPLGGGGTISLVGDVTTPSNCVIAPANTHGITCLGSRRWGVSGFDVAPQGIGHSVNVSLAGVLSLTAMEYAATQAGYYHNYCLENSILKMHGGHRIKGNSQGFMYAYSNSLIQCVAQTITLENVPAFLAAFMRAGMGGHGRVNALTFVGAGANKRYISDGNSIIEAYGGPDYFPGNVAGSVSNGGLYL